jgi:sec-independent protein translocase protein TatA
MPGFTELIVILVILVIIFGANKLPALGTALGRMMKNFRRARRARDEIEVSSSDPGGDLPPGDEHKS